VPRAEGRVRAGPPGARPDPRPASRDLVQAVARALARKRSHILRAPDLRLAPRGMWRRTRGAVRPADPTPDQGGGSGARAARGACGGLIMVERDFRGFLEILRREGELVEVTEPVSLTHELAARVDASENAENKALLFRAVH